MTYTLKNPIKPVRVVAKQEGYLPKPMDKRKISNKLSLTMTNFEKSMVIDKKNFKSRYVKGNLSGVLK